MPPALGVANVCLNALTSCSAWRHLKGANRLPLVIEGVPVTDGVFANDTENRAAWSDLIFQSPVGLGLVMSRRHISALSAQVSLL